MKKFIITIAIIAIASTSMANLADGDFTGSGWVATGTRVVLGGGNANLDAGWQSSGDTYFLYDTVNDRAERVPNSTMNNFYALGQVCAGSSFNASDVVLSFDYDITEDGAADADIEVRVFGRSSSYLYNTGITLYDVLSVNGNMGTLLGTLSMADIGTASGTANVALDLGDTLDTYDWINIGIGVRAIGVSDTAYIDNASIHAIPEPAFLGLLGLGILGFIRRK